MKKRNHYVHCGVLASALLLCSCVSKNQQAPLSNEASANSIASTQDSASSSDSASHQSTESVVSTVLETEPVISFYEVTPTEQQKTENSIIGTSDFTYVVLNPESLLSLLSSEEFNSKKDSSFSFVFKGFTDDNFSIKMSNTWDQIVSLLQDTKIITLDFSESVDLKYFPDLPLQISMENLILPESLTSLNNQRKNVLVTNSITLPNHNESYPMSVYYDTMSPEYFIYHGTIEELMQKYETSLLMMAKTSIITDDGTYNPNELLYNIDENKIQKFYGSTGVSLRKTYTQSCAPVVRSDRNSTSLPVFHSVEKADYQLNLDCCHDILVYNQDGIEIHFMFDVFLSNSEYPQNMGDKFVLIKTPKEEKIYLTYTRFSGYLLGASKVFETADGSTKYFEIVHNSCPNTATNGYNSEVSLLVKIQNGLIEDLTIYDKRAEDIESGRSSSTAYFESNGEVYLALTTSYSCFGMPPEFNMYLAEISSGYNVLSNETLYIYNRQVFSREEETNVVQGTKLYKDPAEDSEVVFTCPEDIPLEYGVTPKFTGADKNGKWYFEVKFNYNGSTISGWTTRGSIINKPLD